MNPIRWLMLNRSTWLYPLLGIGGFLLAWQLSASLNLTRLPGPLSLWTDERTRELLLYPFYDRGGLDKGLFWQTMASLGRVAQGYVLAALVGISAGITVGLSPALNRALDPLFQFLRMVAPLAWVPIALVIFQKNQPAAIFVIFITAVSAAVRRSRFGLQLLAIRDDEDRALGLGVKVTSVKIVGFTLSAFTIGMAGALYAMEQGQIYPQFVFNPVFDVSVALMAFLGGLGTLTGPLLGALILESSQQYLTVSFSNGSLYLILFGSLFLIVILFMPQGIVVYLRDRLSKKAELDRAAMKTNDVAISGGTN